MFLENLEFVQFVPFHHRKPVARAGAWEDGRGHAAARHGGPGEQAAATNLSHSPANHLGQALSADGLQLAPILGGKFRQSDF
jgi:hypothetical protein